LTSLMRELRGSANQTTVGAGITYSFDVAQPF